MIDEVFQSSSIHKNRKVDRETLQVMDVFDRIVSKLLQPSTYTSGRSPICDVNLKHISS
jgi:hypothetical protein